MFWNKNKHEESIISEETTKTRTDMPTSDTARKRIEKAQALQYDELMMCVQQLADEKAALETKLDTLMGVLKTIEDANKRFDMEKATANEKLSAQEATLKERIAAYAALEEKCHALEQTIQEKEQHEQQLADEQKKYENQIAETTAALCSEQNRVFSKEEAVTQLVEEKKKLELLLMSRDEEHKEHDRLKLEITRLRGHIAQFAAEKDRLELLQKRTTIQSSIREYEFKLKKNEEDYERYISEIKDRKTLLEKIIEERRQIETQLQDARQSEKYMREQLTKKEKTSLHRHTVEGSGS